VNAGEAYARASGLPPENIEAAYAASYRSHLRTGAIAPLQTCAGLARALGDSVGPAAASRRLEEIEKLLEDMK
jgi:hypothetical protein